MNTSKKNASMARPDEIITFGVYPQTAHGTHRTPIQWRVLQNAADALFLLSEYILVRSFTLRG